MVYLLTISINHTNQPLTNKIKHDQPHRFTANNHQLPLRIPSSAGAHAHNGALVAQVGLPRGVEGVQDGVRGGQRRAPEMIRGRTGGELGING